MLTLNIFTLFCDYWWLPWLLPLLLSLLSLWLLRKHWQQKYADLEGVAQGLRKDIAGLESDLADCGKEKTKLKGDLAICEGRYRELEQSIKLQREKDLSNAGNIITGSAEAGLTATSSLTSSDSDDSDEGAVDSSVNDMTNASNQFVDKYEKIKDDNLQILEGIGPKMESILKENGISDLTTLAGKSHAELKAVLDKYGDKYKIIDPSDWTAQAKLASDRDFDGLVAYQKADGSAAKAEKLFVKLGIIKSYKLDDLKAVEGIGPKIELLLNEAGINTWRGLAETSVEKLNSILAAAGARYKLADPTTWPKQAEYAADGEWDALEAYQDFLDGGRTPS